MKVKHSYPSEQHKSKGKQEILMEERENKVKDDHCHKNPNSMNEGVIISVYVESPTRNSLTISEPIMKRNNKKTNPHSKITQRSTQSPGYDRRAQLLAYAHELRNPDSPHLHQFSKTNSKSRPRKWKWPVKSAKPAATVRVPSRRMLQRSRSQWRYQRIMKEDMKKPEVVDQPCHPKCFSGKNKKSTGKISSALLGKVKGYAGRIIKWF